MSARRKLKEHMQQLAEIRDIMNAMKNLALLETHKLEDLLFHQQRLAADLESIAADFLAFYPWPRENDEATDCFVIFGAERGFCGDFNAALLRSLETLLEARPAPPILVAVGNKLNPSLRDDARVSAFVEGADFAEEVIPVLSQLVRQLGRLQSGSHPIILTAVFHEASTGQVALRRLMPPFEQAGGTGPAHAYPPLIYIEPSMFFSDLLDRYLFVALQEIAYTSLMAENLQRIQHMTGAVTRLDETAERLTRAYHMRRQEDITEEIEVILLNATREFN